MRIFLAGVACNITDLRPTARKAFVFSNNLDCLYGIHRRYELCDPVRANINGDYHHGTWLVREASD